jgi:hypothetical protein
MDHAFDRLYASCFGNAPLRWEEFAAVALQYFDNNATVAAAHDDYFTNFTVIWGSIIDTGRLDRAEHVWEQALHPALEWERAHQGQHLHKGTAYYFWAMTALLRGDTDRGYLLIHQSYDEDTRTSGRHAPDTPAYALVSLNHNQTHQAFRQWTVEHAAFLNDLIASYASTHQRVLTIEDVKRRFIDIPSSLETVFLLTYTIARLRKIAGLPEHVTNNPFAGQLQINLLFDVTLVIDAAIKAKNSPSSTNPNPTFIHHAERLLGAAGHQLSNQELGEINGQFRSNFDLALREALDGNLTLQSGAVLGRLQCDVAVAYGLRNRGAHNIGTVPIISNRFRALQQALFSVLCAAIDHLY